MWFAEAKTEDDYRKYGLQALILNREEENQRILIDNKDYKNSVSSYNGGITMSRLISDKYESWKAECNDRFAALKANEEELNRKKEAH